MELTTHFFLALIAVFAMMIHIHAQDQSGFISIDCGSPKNTSYTEETTGINYISDESFIDIGISHKLSAEQKLTKQQQFTYLRSFPQGTRNCYNIKTKKGTKYLIRAFFLYGNFDGQNNTKFDLHLGPNYWDTFEIHDSYSATLEYFSEIIHIPLRDHVHVCLINTGFGTPFISVLEFRPLNNEAYVTPSYVSLSLVQRWDVGAPIFRSYRYPYDQYDREWSFYTEYNWKTLTTPLNLSYQNSSIYYQLPSIVMRTAVTPNKTRTPLKFTMISNASIDTEYYFYMHFAELQQRKANESRAFNITINSFSYYKNYNVSDYLVPDTLYSTKSISGYSSYNISLVKLENSTLPPILNAIEAYSSIDLSAPETDPIDVDAMMNIKSSYGIYFKNWEGDPCVPVDFLWNGLNCTNLGSEPPRVIFLNLSSSRLTGEISPFIANLTMLQILDLSNNSLSGHVPEFLTRLTNLTFLNLANNKFTGSIPAELIQRSKDGSLSLISGADLGDETNTCTSPSCKKKKKKKKKNITLILAIAFASGLVIILAAAILVTSKRKKHQGHLKRYNAHEGTFKSKQREFTYAEVLEITNNFESILGKGGFGTVYHGFIEDTQVAVKMLSPSSVQGYQEFQAEVRLLMRVHHRNLTSLVGYCHEDTELALIYEYMDNGNLQSYLSDSSEAEVLNWEGRLKIALDAAQGLEYLHNGCKPPIIHRDVKTANILLSENFQAKIADFGLSKIFQTDCGTHISTIPAGTPGYLDPEYFTTNRLTEKSDVYSFGVVLLEIITGQRAITRLDNETAHVRQWVSSKLANGDIKGIIDPRLQGGFKINSIWKAVEIAMTCLCQTSIQRPNMSQVVTELKECLATQMDQKHESHVTDFPDSIVMTTELRPSVR